MKNLLQDNEWEHRHGSLQTSIIYFSLIISILGIILCLYTPNHIL